MTDRSRVTNRSAVDLSAVIPWVNDSGTEIPAYAVVQLRVEYDTTSHANMPNSSDGLFFVNGPVPIPAAKGGESLVWNRPRVVLLDPTANVGDQVGPVSGSWQMTTAGTGFRVLRQAEAGRGVVVQVGGGGADVRVGIVRTVRGCGFYTVELGYLPANADADGASGSVTCDPCTNVVGSGTSACVLEIADPPSRVVGDGQFVTAYDTFSDKILLRSGTDVVVARVPGRNETSGSIASGSAGSGSGSGSGPEEIWVVLNGYHEHIVQYRERGECCPTTGQWLTTHKTPIILLGHECEEIQCAECPTGSSSGSV